jgi:catechol 2,3-dioxygenase-like lactoylglutathione lyase family enzyme
VLTRLHHVQVACPAGSEDALRAFYGDVLGMTEVPKPEVMARRGGAWFRAGGVELHLGAEDDFVPDRKGHPGILVDDLDDVAARLTRAEWPLRWDDDFPGFRRFYANDPFGNRMEFLEER